MPDLVKLPPGVSYSLSHFMTDLVKLPPGVVLVDVDDVVRVVEPKDGVAVVPVNVVRVGRDCCQPEDRR